MEEWKEYRLDSICQLSAGGDAPQNAVKHPNGEMIVPIFSNGEGERGLYGYTNYYKVKAPAVTISARGNIGYVCYRKANYVPIVRLITAKANEQFVSNEFLYYLLRNTHIWGDGSVQKQLTVPMISEYLVRIPSLLTQDKVVAILKSLDDKIEVNRRINENLEQQAQALFKSWFVDFEPFKNGEFVESELGMIPKGWRVGMLNEIADITMGASPSGTSYNTDGLGDVFYQGRAEFGFRFPKRNMFTTEAKRFAEVDSVLVSVRAPVGDINVAEERCCIGRGLASVISKTNYNSYILYLLKNLKSVFDRFNGEGTVFGSINKKAFEEMQIIIPTENVISKFNSIASSMDCQIKKTELESRRLATLRDTLLPKLMSGELKVNEVEI